VISLIFLKRRCDSEIHVFKKSRVTPIVVSQNASTRLYCASKLLRRILRMQNPRSGRVTENAECWKHRKSANTGCPCYFLLLRKRPSVNRSLCEQFVPWVTSYRIDAQCAFSLQMNLNQNFANWIDCMRHLCGE